MTTQGKNAVGGERKFWGVIPVLPAPQLSGLAKQMEDTGFEGATALQIYGTPWPSLAIAAAATSRLKIATGVAVAGSRSPFETAMIAMDMDRMSEGRFTLGLGTGVSSVNVGAYGMPDYKLITHMRDTVAAVRHVIGHAHTGLAPYDGAYFKADFKELMLTAPPIREKLPIWVAALRQKLTDATLEIADGLMVHSLWSRAFLIDQQSRIDTKLAEFGRKRADIEINAWPWVAVNDSKQQAIDDSRPTVAGYAGIKEYEGFFDALGFGKEARLCQLGDQSNSLAIMHHVPDEMVLAFVACGSVDEVLEQIEPYWRVADSLCCMAPYRHFTLEQHMFYSGGLHRLVAAATR
jgi:alkanesulfonate monooxygenase SsuD/methylene tetrahydromethanopterin reductase-like flavin-dependent oxidoreductase (luciferase family)